MSIQNNYDVFLSYSSEDKIIVQHIADKLTENGLRVWFDDKVIPYGADILLEVERGISDSRYFIFCASESSLKSEYALAERHIVNFRDPANKSQRFIPLILNDNLNLPDALRRFKHINYHANPDDALMKIIENCRMNSAVEVSKVSDAEHSATKPGLLYVEDEELSRKYFERQFENDYTIFLADNVDDAIVILLENNKRIAVAFVDVRLPKRLGTELLKVMHEQYPQIMRIIVSAYSDSEAFLSAINECGVHQYILKPWTESNMRMIAKYAVNAHINSEKIPGFHAPIPPPKSPVQDKISSFHSEVKIEVPQRNGLDFSLLQKRLAEQEERLKLQEFRIAELESTSIDEKTQNQKNVDTVFNAHQSISNLDSIVFAIKSETVIICAQILIDYPSLRISMHMPFRRHVSQLYLLISSIKDDLPDNINLDDSKLILNLRNNTNLIASMYHEVTLNESKIARLAHSMTGVYFAICRAHGHASILGKLLNSLKS